MKVLRSNRNPLIPKATHSTTSAKKAQRPQREQAVATIYRSFGFDTETAGKKARASIRKMSCRALKTSASNTSAPMEVDSPLKKYPAPMDLDSPIKHSSNTDPVVPMDISPVRPQSADSVDKIALAIGIAPKSGAKRNLLENWAPPAQAAYVPTQTARGSYEV